MPNFVEIVRTAAEICEFQYYANLAWKCLFTLLLGFLGAPFPLMMLLIVLTPKRTILGLNHVIWAINRKYRSRSSSWALEREKRNSMGQDKTGQDRKESQKGHISPICGEAPTEAMYMKICGWCSRRNHVCQVSKWNFQGLRFYRESNFHWFLNGPYYSAALLGCL